MSKATAVKKNKYRDMGMDTCERLYYIRQEERKKAYEEKQVEKPKKKKSVAQKREDCRNLSAKFAKMTNTQDFENFEDDFEF